MLDKFANEEQNLFIVSPPPKKLIFIQYEQPSSKCDKEKLGHVCLILYILAIDPGPCHLGGGGVSPPPKKSKKGDPACEEAALERGTCKILRNFLQNWSKKVFKTKFKSHYVNLVFEKIFGTSPLPSIFRQNFLVSGKKFLRGPPNGRGPKFFISPPPNQKPLGTALNRSLKNRNYNIQLT